MTLVKFERSWRNYQRGTTVDLNGPMAVQLERRGFVSRVSPEPEPSAVPANKAATTSDVPVKTMTRPRRKRRRSAR